MSFKNRVAYFLVHALKYTNKDAKLLIKNGNVKINGDVVIENLIISTDSEVCVNGIIERSKKEYVYLKFYKPMGYESTLNATIANNLSVFF